MATALKDLELAGVPPADATDDEIAVFALSFNGYEYTGSLAACAAAALCRAPNLAALRCALFFEQRRARFTNIDTSAKMRELVDKIRAAVQAGKAMGETPSANEQLRLLYEARWDEISASIPTASAMSQPFLIKLPATFDSCDIKLAVVGKETHGWWSLWQGSENRSSIGPLRDRYAGFFAGKHRSPFFRGAYRLQAILNPSSAHNSFAWLNVFPADQNRSTPSPAVADRLRELNLLGDELAIVKPDAIVFFTGPHYDYTLRALFPDLTFHQLFPGADALKARRLQGAVAVRTYHPNYLQQSKRFGLLDAIAGWIKQQLDAAGRR